MEMIKLAISRHLANRCDVCATPGRLTFSEAPDSPLQAAAGSKIFFARQCGPDGPARRRIRQAHHQDAYQGFRYTAARVLYPSMNSCSNYPA
jgi:hypothetical protein